MIIQKNILDKFQREKRRSDCSVSQFILDSQQVFSSEQQLDLIRCDLRIRFIAGEEPVVGDYEPDFPHFSASILELIDSTAKLVIDEYLPIEETFGSLPVQVGDYRIERRVNRDCCSVHYDAVRVSLDRRVRVRALLFPTAPAIAKAKALALIEHPNLDNTLNVLRVNGVVMIVSHWVVGNSLQSLLKSAPQSITSRRLVHWTKRIANGLAEAHRFDLHHDAICPDNILIREDGEAVLVNFSFNAPDKSPNIQTQKLWTEVLPFPYRSVAELTMAGESAIADTRALGLVFFQMLVRKPLDGFYGQMLLPNETERLTRVIEDGLNSLSDEQASLRALCERATLLAIADPASWNLDEFENELGLWDRRRFLSKIKESDSTVLSVNEGVKSIGAVAEFRSDPDKTRRHRFLPEIRKFLSSFSF